MNYANLFEMIFCKCFSEKKVVILDASFLKSLVGMHLNPLQVHIMFSGCSVLFIRLKGLHA